MDTLVQDLRYALRQLARTPGFTIVAVLTLALGIGANTALFSLANSVFLRPLPGVHNDGRLVWITPQSARTGRTTQMPYPDFVDYRDAGIFEQAAAFAGLEFSLGGADEPVRARGQIVSANYFSMLGVPLELGRGFSPENDDVASEPVAVISDRLWRERFGADASAIGRRIAIDGHAFTIVGIAPPKFVGIDLADRDRDIWVPMGAQAVVAPDLALRSREAWWLSAAGKLKGGTSLAHAKAATATIAQRIALADSAGHQGIVATLAPMRGGVPPKDVDQAAPIGFLASAATALILLICCANVSNMLFARAVRRRHEITVRLSVGATRRRVVRQLLTESLMLALCASIAGLVAAMWATDALTKALIPTADVSLESHTIGFAIAIAAVTSLLFGTLPAIGATQGDLAVALRDGATLVDRRRSKVQGALVIAQIALSLVLLITSSMFLGGLYDASQLELGFDASAHVVAGSFDLGLQGYTTERTNLFLSMLTRNIAGLPGVTSVSVTNAVPLGNRRSGADVKLDPRESDQTTALNSGGLYSNIIRPGYFRTIGIDLVVGRDFTADDGPTRQAVAIVSEDFATRAWPGANPLGKHVTLRGEQRVVVGVARTARTFAVGERLRPIVYRPQLQTPEEHSLSLVVRSVGNAADLGPSIRGAVRALDRDLPLFDLQTLGANRRTRLSDIALGSTLLGLIGAVSLLLASVGLFAVVSFSVGQRVREIGLRMALGAAGRDVSSLFLRDGVRLTLIGVAAGAVLSVFMARTIAAQFVSVSVVRASLFLAVAALLGFVTLAATWIPARRAALVDPMVALRSE
jgi:predicted permease